MKEDASISIGDIADHVDLNLMHTEAYICDLEKSWHISSEGWLKNRRWIVHDKN